LNGSGQCISGFGERKAKIQISIFSGKTGEIFILKEEKPSKQKSHLR
jgi:hypothetical protein